MVKNYSQKSKIENLSQKLFEKIKPAQNQRKNVKKSTFKSKKIIFGSAYGAILHTTVKSIRGVDRDLVWQFRISSGNSVAVRSHLAIS